MSISRVYSGFSNTKNTQLHCFSDASKVGFGAVCYLRIDNGNGISCSYVIGKSRVTPMASLSTPRLELCSAVTVVRLSLTVDREHDFPIDKIFF